MHVSSSPLTRRHFLAGVGVAGLAAALAACGGNSTAPRSTDAAAGQFAALERRFGGRLGVHALDTGDGTTVGYRSDERFLLCSTFKLLAVAAVLARRQSDPGLLDRVVTWPQSVVLDNSPVTSAHVAGGLSVGALCQAAMVPSDNTAANLLMDMVGGPAGLTSWCREQGDKVTEIDHTEPTINRVDGQDDTSSPTAMVGNAARTVLGSTLDLADRNRLADWMVACQTGTHLVRAGVPASWRVGDKSGSGYRNEANDVAVIWPPHRKPLVIAVFADPTDPNSMAAPAAVAHAASIAVGALT